MNLLSRQDFVQLVEESLQAQNIECREKRLSKRLGPIMLDEVPAGTFASLRQKRMAEGAAEAQVKIPLIAPVDCNFEFPVRNARWRSPKVESFVR